MGLFGSSQPKNPARSLSGDSYLKSSKVPHKGKSNYYSGLGGSTKANISNNSLTFKQRDPYLEGQMQRYNNLINYAGSQLGRPDQQKLANYEQAYYQRAMQPVQQAYDQGNLAAREQFNGMGMLNSTGYEDYRKKNLDQVYQQGLQNAAEDAYMAREQLRSADDQRNLAIMQAGQQGFGDVRDLGLRQSDLGRLMLGAQNDYQNNWYRNQLSRLQTQGSFM